MHIKIVRKWIKNLRGGCSDLPVHKIEQTKKGLSRIEGLSYNKPTKVFCMHKKLQIILYILRLVISHAHLVEPNVEINV